VDNYTVYKHTSPSGKVYIGITRQRPAARWSNGTGYKHSPHFLAAVKKYGWDNIRHEILAEGLSREQAEQLEVELIAKYKATDKAYGYNIDRGGSAPGMKSAETRQKISAAVSGENHPNYGKKQSPEWVAKRMAATKGRRLSPEHLAKLEAARKVQVKCLDTGEIYESATDAGRRLNINNSKITAVCRGRRKTAGGLRWEYVKEATT
jgi:group I intron endonuclease